MRDILTTYTTILAILVTIHFLILKKTKLYAANPFYHSGSDDDTPSYFLFPDVYFVRIFVNNKFIIIRSICFFYCRRELKMRPIITIDELRQLGLIGDIYGNKMDHLGVENIISSSEFNHQAQTLHFTGQNEKLFINPKRWSDK